MGLSVWMGIMMGIVLIGIVLIGMLIWLFQRPKREETRASMSASGFQEVFILIDGGCSSNTIVVKRGKPVRLEIMREQSASCSDLLVFPDFHKIVVLPVGIRVSVELFPHQSGRFPFYCQLGRFRGTLIVKD